METPKRIRKSNKEVAEMKIKLIDLYLEGKTLKEMCVATDSTLESVKRHLYVLRKQGKLPKETRRDGLGINKDQWNETEVHCSRKVSGRCLFGCAETSANLCDYILDTGHSRGCHWKHCHRFQPRPRGYRKPAQIAWEKK